MQYLFEYCDTLNFPYEAFRYDTSTMPFPIRPHCHYFMAILYMLEGTALVGCDGQSYVAQEGDLILFHPETVHAIYTATNVPLKYDVLKFDVNRLYTENSYAPKLRVILDSASKSSKASIFFKESQLEGLVVSDIFEECCKELEQQDYGYDIVIHNKICYLLVQIIRLWRHAGFNTDAAAAHARETNSIHAITSYIDSHVGEVIRVEDLAEMCNMSYSYFAKNFKQYYGRSCKEYIEFIRVRKAADLLLFTDFD